MIETTSPIANTLHIRWLPRIDWTQIYHPVSKRTLFEVLIQDPPSIRRRWEPWRWVLASDVRSRTKLPSFIFEYEPPKRIDPCRNEKSVEDCLDESHASLDKMSRIWHLACKTDEQPHVDMSSCAPVIRRCVFKRDGTEHGRTLSLVNGYRFLGQDISHFSIMIFWVRSTAPASDGPRLWRCKQN